MSPANARFLASYAVAVAITAQCLFAQDRELALRVNRAVAALDSAQTERGIDSLRALLGEWPQDGSIDLRVRATVHLGAASVSLGLRDSALVHFRDAIRVNPFGVLDRDIFNPEIVALFREARRTTPRVGIRVAGDTVIEPLAEPYLVAVAVGQPGDVSVHLVRVGGTPPSVGPTQLTVDSTASFVVPLRVSDSVALEPGDYRLTAAMPGTAAPVAVALLRITRQPVDTTAREPALDSALFRPETKKGPPVPMSALSGIAFGVAAAAVPMVLGNKDLGSGKVQVPAISVGLGISVAGIAGVAIGRRMVPIHENIQYNRSLVTAWEQRNRAIAEANEHKRRLAPLRITLVEEHP